MTSIASTAIEMDAFAPFGSVAVLPSSSPLAESDEFRFWSDVTSYRVDGDTEIGFCEVFPHPENRVVWMERHERTPELLVAMDGDLVLPVMTSDEKQVRAFRFGPGQAVVIGQNVWHSACLPAGSNPARYFVIFRRGTPAEDVIKTDIAPVTVRLA